MKWANELKKIRKDAKLSQQKMADMIGIPQRTWANYESGRSNPKMEIFFALAEKGYTIPGLTTGLNQDLADKGMSQQEIDQRRQTAEDRRIGAPLDTPIDDEWAEKVDGEYRRQFGKNAIKVYEQSELLRGAFVVPLLDQRLSAGGGSHLPEDDECTALIRVPSHLSRYGKNLAALIVDGDSMYPTLQRGDMVVCDSCGWSGEGIYALRMSGEGFVKRLSKKPGKIVIISDNEKYPAYEESEDSDDIQIIGRVHCAITKIV